MPHTADDTLLQAMRLLQQDPQVSQRALAHQLGLSLGKTNYCLQALLAKGWVKAESFRKSSNKMAYSYMLTPQGMAEKAQLTARFLQRKLAEYDRLQREIADLRSEVLGPPFPKPSPARGEEL
jgi:EPS-associated MarR family transcriptional regulator